MHPERTPIIGIQAAFNPTVSFEPIQKPRGGRSVQGRLVGQVAGQRPVFIQERHQHEELTVGEAQGSDPILVITGDLATDSTELKANTVFEDHDATLPRWSILQLVLCQLSITG